MGSTPIRATDTNKEQHNADAYPLETHTPDQQKTGSWCQRQHIGLLIRKMGVRIPPALLRGARHGGV